MGLFGFLATALSLAVSLIAGTFCGSALQAAMRTGMSVQARVAVELTLMVCGAIGFSTVESWNPTPFGLFVAATPCATLATTGAVAMFEGAIFNILESMGLSKGYFYLAALIVCCLSWVAMITLGNTVSNGVGAACNVASRVKLHYF